MNITFYIIPTVTLHNPYIAFMFDRDACNDMRCLCLILHCFLCQLKQFTVNIATNITNTR